MALLFIAGAGFMLGRTFSATALATSLTGFQYFFGNQDFGRHLWFLSAILACYCLLPPTRAIIRNRSRLFFPLLLVCILACNAIIGGSLYNNINAVQIIRLLFHFGMFASGVALANSLQIRRALAFLNTIGSVITSGISAITFEIYLVHVVVIQGVDVFFHGSFAAYPIAFAVTICVAAVVRKVARIYAQSLEAVVCRAIGIKIGVPRLSSLRVPSKARGVVRENNL